MSLITREFETPFGMIKLEQRAKDGYVFITPMFRAAGKRFQDWHRSVDAQEYLAAFKVRNPHLDPLDIKHGGRNHGVWAHPRAALRAAQWIHPLLAVIVDEIVEWWYTEGGKYQQAVIDTINMYVLPNPVRWQSRYPEEFMFHVYRLKNKADEWERGKTQHQPWVSGAIDELIYQRHFPGDVMAEIRRKNPTRKRGGGRARKHMQHMTKDADDNALKPAIYMAISVMQRSHSWERCLAIMDVIAPKDKQQLLLPMDALL